MPARTKTTVFVVVLFCFFFGGGGIFLLTIILARSFHSFYQKLRQVFTDSCDIDHKDKPSGNRRYGDERKRAGKAKL